MLFCRSRVICWCNSLLHSQTNISPAHSVYSTSLGLDCVVHINPFPHLLPFPHVWQNLDWSNPRSFKRRSIVVSSAWEGCSFSQQPWGGGIFFFPTTLSLFTSSIYVCLKWLCFYLVFKFQRILMMWYMQRNHMPVHSTVLTTVCWHIHPCYLYLITPGCLHSFSWIPEWLYTTCNTAWIFFSF